MNDTNKKIPPRIINYISKLSGELINEGMKLAKNNRALGFSTGIKKG
jgi:hypothetical protein